MARDEAVHVIEASVAVVLLNLGAVAVEEHGGEAVDLLGCAQLATGRLGAVHLGDLDPRARRELGAEFLPCWCHALTMATPAQFIRKRY